MAIIELVFIRRFFRWSPGPYNVCFERLRNFSLWIRDGVNGNWIMSFIDVSITGMLVWIAFRKLKKNHA
jgi:hypothetical protein